MADKKEDPASVEQAPEAQPYEIKHDLPKKPVIAPDGHVNLSEEDIKNRA